MNIAVGPAQADYDLENKPQMNDQASNNLFLVSETVSLEQ